VDQKEKTGYEKVETGIQVEKDKYYTDILQEYNTFSSQREKRVALLNTIAKIGKTNNKKVGVIAFIADPASMHSSIDTKDVTAMGSALMSIGHVDVLRLIINSPGGDGVTAEKIVDMCRSYCKKFEVIIPNMAKSAATMIALGSDEITMGYCSEIGPIDAQVPIMVDGIPRMISAQSFINARKSLLKDFQDAVTQQKDVRAILQQIASLNIPFIEQCEKYMQFGRDMVGKYLAKYMFKKDASNKTTLETKINKVLQDLSSTDTFIVHGRMINAHTAKTALGLNVKPLGKDSPDWKAIWEYYVRADIALGITKGSTKPAKMIETITETLIAA
jgi:ClpP class serine protease